MTKFGYMHSTGRVMGNVFENINPQVVFEIFTIEIITTSPRGEWVKRQTGFNSPSAAPWCRNVSINLSNIMFVFVDFPYENIIDNDFSQVYIISMQ